MIYRGARLVNWDCALQTAVSDDEIEYVSRKDKLYYLRYPVKGTPGTFVIVATVLLAVAVIASVIPAWRAARADPTSALRAD